MSGASWYRKILESWGLMNTTNHFLDCVVAGAYTIDLSECEFQYMLESAVSTPDITPALLQAKDNLERINIMTDIFPTDQFRKALVNVCIGFQKDAAIARKFEDRGRQFEVDLTFDKALRCYNLATLFAPPKTQNWGRIYAFRAGLFHVLNEHENCLKDIKLALKNHCPGVLKPEIFRIGELSTKAFHNQDDTNELKPEILEMREYRDEVIFKLDGKRNLKIPSAIEGITIRKNEKKGRYLTTDRKLPPGSTVILEKPYIAILNNTAKWDTTHCSKCFAKVQRVVPCSGCVFVNYCSESCKVNDFFDGHQYQCPCYPLLHAMRMSINNMLSFKAICKEGPKNLYERFLNTLIEDEEKNPGPNFIEGFDPKTGKYDSDSYHQILNFKSHLNEEKLPRLTWFAVAIITALEEQTDFFYESEKYDNQDFKNYVGSVYLQHAIAFPFNAVQLNEQIEIECTFVPPDEPAGGVHFLESTDLAAGVFPLTSLMCHSCDPTVFRQSLPNGEIAIITHRELNPGDELQLSYGFGFLVDKFSERLDMTVNTYKFKCDCHACVLKFPPYNEMNWTRKFLCPNCSDHFKDSPIIQTKFCCMINGPGPHDLICPNCSEVSKVSKMIEEADKIETIVNEANSFIMDGNGVAAIPLLVKAIPLYQALLCVPSKEIYYPQLLLCEAYAMIANS